MANSFPAKHQTQQNSEWEYPLARKMPFYLSLLVMLGGMAVLAGWQFRIPILKGEFGGTFVAPNTALCFIVLGAALWILLCFRSNRYLGTLCRGLALVVVVFSSLILYEHLTGANLGIDQLFFNHRMSDWNIRLPLGRIAWPTAVNFVLIGLSIAFFGVGKKPTSEYLAVTSASITMLALLGYSFQVPQFHRTLMSVYATVFFALLDGAVLLGQEQARIANVVMSKRAGGIVARRMLVFTVLILPLFGMLNISMERAGIMSVELGTALQITIMMLVFAIMAVQITQALNELDYHRIQSEIALRNSEKLAATGRLAATIAHEINNPLEAVTNLFYLLLREENMSSSAKQFLAQAENELSRISHITKQTLGFYREASAAADVELGEVLDEVVALYSNKITTRGVEIQRFYNAPGLVRMVKGEARQIFSNLLSNAIDALPHGDGVIKIAIYYANAAKTRVAVEILDNGCGIAPQLQEEVFEPFFTTKKDVGTGLGLWVTRQLVQKNGGQIKINSSVEPSNRGTSVAVVFPEANQAAVKPDEVSCSKSA